MAIIVFLTGIVTVYSVLSAAKVVSTRDAIIHASCISSCYLLFKLWELI